MVIRNTSRYPSDEVRAIVRWAVGPIDMRRVCVNVKNSRSSFAGMAYDYVPSISNANPTAERLVTLRIGPPEKFPATACRYPNTSDRFPTYDLQTWQEALVHIAAHEAAHVEQFREGTKRSELRAEMFAVGRVEKWRSRG